MTAPKARWFWPLAALLLLADCGTKQLVEEQLTVEHLPHEVIGNTLRLTLIYNTGAAFSTSLGDYSRVVFSALAMVIVAVLYRMYRDADAHDRALGAALGLIVGGAVGNLVDRLRSPRGVVDFIDVGIGDARFWVFNIADVGVTTGAALLLYLMLRRSHSTEPHLK
ncbi:MAG: signal peptidase II [Gemmatimonadaceae bacterium]|nr:signal peptidase II [Gemmatimonadaceae bacterium]